MSNPMRALRRTVMRVLALFDSTRRDADLAEELQAHLQMRIDDHVRAGRTLDEARRLATLESGGLELAKEIYRDRRSLPLLDQTLRDLGYAARQCRAHPTFTLVAVFSLALGIGANTAVFSIVNAVLFAEPPYVAPGRLISVTQSLPALGEASLGTSPGEYLDYRDRTRTFASIGGYTRAALDAIGPQESERLEAARVTASVFEVLGESAQLGRTLSPEDETPGAPRVVLVSHEYWRQRLAESPLALGATLTLNEQPHTIIGVMPSGFTFPATRLSPGDPPAIWLPLSHTEQQRASRATSFDTHVIARLKPDVTLDHATSDVARVADEFQGEYPEVYRGHIRLRASATPWGVDTARAARPMLIALGGAVGLVLLIACANVASLLLGRASTRRREIAVRRALGASDGRIVRQLLTEAVLLAAMGGVAGTLLAYVCTTLVASRWPEQFISLRDVRIDPRVLAFTCGLSILTGLICGLGPALGTRDRRLRPRDALMGGSRQTGGDREGRRARQALVIVEAAGALVLLIGAGLLVHSFIRVMTVPLGFNPDHVLIVRTTFNRQRYPESEGRQAAQRALLERLTALPGIKTAALTTHVPLADERQIGFALERDGPDRTHWAANALVSGNYFAAMAIPLVRGRTFTDDDTPRAPLVTIVNESLARRFWPDRDPIGERILWGGRRLTIVGIAGDVHVKAVDMDVEPTIYCSVYQVESGATTSGVFIVRTDGSSPMMWAAPARAAIRSVDAGLPVFDTRPMTQVVARSLASRRFLMMVFAAFAGVALSLAIVGLYAVLSHTVTQRTPELGLRLALGARPAELLMLVLKDGVRLVVAGLAIGMAATAALAGGLSALLFGVERFDPLTVLAASGLLLGVSVIASYVPARRAARIDPMSALRSDGP
jgi:putative ABC transport system permease protein